MLIIISPSIHPLLCILHPCTVFILCFIRCQFRRLSSVLAHSLSVVNEGLVPPPDPVCGSSNSFPWCCGLWIVGCDFRQAWQFLVMLVSTWVCRSWGSPLSKEGQYVNASACLSEWEWINEVSSACQWNPVVEAIPHWTEESSYLSVPTSRHIIRYSCCVGVSVVYRVWGFVWS